MARVQLLAVISMDGHLLEHSGDAYDMLHNEDHGMKEMFADADYVLTDVYPVSMLIENDSRAKYLFQATSENVIYANGLLRLQLVHEIILYIVPYIAGTGKRLFSTNLPMSCWKPVSKKEYKNGTICIVFHKIISRK